jgi:hypothetical protein
MACAARVIGIWPTHTAQQPFACGWEVNNFAIAQLNVWQSVRFIHPSNNRPRMTSDDFFGKLCVLKAILKESFGHGRVSVVRGQPNNHMPRFAEAIFSYKIGAIFVTGKLEKANNCNELVAGQVMRYNGDRLGRHCGAGTFGRAAGAG